MPSSEPIAAVTVRAGDAAPRAVPGRYRARLSREGADIAAAQALRAEVFRGAAGPSRDADGFDDLCGHLLIEDRASGALAGCCRLLRLGAGAEIGRSYAAQFYDLARLASHAGPMAEIGRFCIRPGPSDAEILRVAWAALTAWVDREGVEMLFGCSSFRGTDPAPYAAAFALLARRHGPPPCWRPGPAADEVVDFAPLAGRDRDDPRGALATLPPLLRSYLAMGGWVSDHAVIDRDLGTLHVFTGLEVAAVPPARARLLRGLAAALPTV